MRGARSTAWRRPADGADPGAGSAGAARDERLLAAALTGDGETLRSLVDRLTPIIQARVARVLLARRPAGAGPGVRAQVEDLAQEVFLLLFADNGRVLRTWQPQRGLSLDNFVGLVACRRALSLLRSGRHAVWREDPTLAEEPEEPSPEADPEAQATSRQELRRLLDRLREELSPYGWQLFDLLLIQGCPVEEAERRTGMSRDALYAWRSRLKRLAQRLRHEMRSETAAGRRTTREEGA